MAEDTLGEPTAEQAVVEHQSKNLAEAGIIR